MRARIFKAFIVFSIIGSYVCNANAQGGIATAPYSCDFENSIERSQWIFLNGQQTNKWYVGTATSCNGQYSLYVSDDGGATYKYSPGTASSTWAYRQIALVAGLYNISYNWKAYGYSGAHYMRAYLVPTQTFNGSAGSATGFTTSGKPTGWIPIDASYPNGNSMHLQSTCQNVYIGNVSIPTTGTYYLVFGWTNTSNASGIQPPAAIDDIQITTATCPRPEDLSVKTGLINGRAEASWTETGTATCWLLEYSSSSNFRPSRTIFVDRSNATINGSTIKYNHLAGFQTNTAYYFRVRAICDTTTGSGDTSMTSTVFNYRYCAGNAGCIDFTSLENNPDVLCTYGKSNNYGSWSPTNSNNNGPYFNIGIRNKNNGHGQNLSGTQYEGASHTIMSDMTEKDSLTNYQLSVIPPTGGDCYSVRLGCRYGQYLCQATAYRFHVDTSKADIVLVKYAVVLVNPSHGDNQSPRFIFEILDTNNNLISPTCGYSNVNARDAANSWNRGIQFANYPVYWKDWTPVGLDLSQYHGQTIIIRITVFACGAGALNHSGYMYYTMGCTKARITSSACGGGNVATTLTAPAGFNYRWYTAKNPNQVVSRQQTVTVQVDSTMYYCDCSFVDDSTCSFTLSTFVSQRYPRAGFTASMSTDSCKYRINLHNTSRVSSSPTGNDSIDECTGYFWDFGNGQTSTDQNTTITYEQPGTYTVKLVAKLNEGECTDTITQHFTFRPHVPSRVIAPRKVWFGDTAMIRAATHKYREYLWNTGYTRDSLFVVPDSTTQYMLIARDSIGCIDTMYATVAVSNCHIYDTTCRNERYLSYGFNIPASTLRNYADTSIVFERHTRSHFGVDSTTTLHLLILDTSEMVTYDTFCYGDPYSFYDIPLIRGGRYSQRFANVHGCDSVIYLELEELPRPRLELHHSYVPCFNYPITLIAHRTGDWIRWSSSPNDTSMSGHETQDTLVVRPHERTIYTATTGLDGYECTTTASTIANLETDLKAYIHSSQEAASLDNMQVIFTDRSSDNTSRTWYLRDFNLPVGTGEQYIYTFKPTEDSVKVLLVAFIDGTECSDTTSVTIPMFKEGVWIPNAFTPDESENNEFVVRGIEITDYEISIYNRYGYLVFRSNDINKSWNGGLDNDRSNICDVGAYSYRIVYKSASQPDRTFNKVGSVMLVR